MTVRPLDPAVIATDRGADRPTSAEDILDLLDALRPAWHADAACRGQTAVMFPERGTTREVRDMAHALCEGCPVRSQCKEAGTFERYGIWGGRGTTSARVNQRERSKTIQNVLADGEWHATSDVARHIDASASTVSRSLNALVARGVLEKRVEHPIHLYRLKETT